MLLSFYLYFALRRQCIDGYLYTFCWPSHNLRLAPMNVQDVKFAVHAHPTLSEVLDELFKAAHVRPIVLFRS